MNNRNKTRIPLNRKDIDEIDSEYKNEETLETVKSNEESNNKSKNPFDDDYSGSLFETNESPFETDELKNPFEDNIKDNSNPFSANNSEYREVVDHEPQGEPVKPNLELAIDADMPYFFVFGNSTAGKSAMLSGLLYYMKTSRIGQLYSLSLNDQEHHRKGDYALVNMTKKVRRGEFIEGTQNLDKLDFVFPTEINLEFEPNIGAKLPFCLLEMAGEDLREIELRDEGRTGGTFDERINAYLLHPECQMIFICVLDVDSPEDSEDLIDGFLTYIQKIGHGESPVLISINKWDKVASQYDSAKDYVKQNLPIIENLLLNNSREMSYMSFSVGDVTTNNGKDTYKFKPDDSKKLLEWMYETATGSSLNREVKQSVGKKIVNSIKNIFR